MTRRADTHRTVAIDIPVFIIYVLNYEITLYFEIPSRKLIVRCTTNKMFVQSNHPTLMSENIMAVDV